jgi:hypothetical protein
MQVLTTARPPSFPQVSAAHFEARGAVPKEDWARVVVLTNLFSIEELGSCGDVRMIDFDCIGVRMIAYAGHLMTC